VIILGWVLIVPKLSLTKMVQWETRGASATPYLSRSKPTNWMPSKLTGAYRTPKHVTQMDVSKSIKT